MNVFDQQFPYPNGGYLHLSVYGDTKQVGRHACPVLRVSQRTYDRPPEFDRPDDPVIAYAWDVLCETLPNRWVVQDNNLFFRLSLGDRWCARVTCGGDESPVHWTLDYRPRGSGSCANLKFAERTPLKDFNPAYVEEHLDHLRTRILTDPNAAGVSSLLFTPAGNFTIEQWKAMEADLPTDPEDPQGLMI
jgi:hypothetical protein